MLDDALGRRPRGRDGQGRVDSPYEAGRRGKAWRKVKPVHTLDLVVLAAEWGHGRRRGWLSNLHLGRPRPDDGAVRHGRQDVQGPHRRAAALADRALLGAGDRSRRRSTSCTSAPSWSWRSRSTACSARPATRAAWPCASPGCGATGRTRIPATPTPSTRCGRCSTGALTVRSAMLEAAADRRGDRMAAQPGRLGPVLRAPAVVRADPRGARRDRLTIFLITPTNAATSAFEPAGHRRHGGGGGPWMVVRVAVAPGGDRRWRAGAHGPRRPGRPGRGGVPHLPGKEVVETFPGGDGRQPGPPTRPTHHDATAPSTTTAPPTAAPPGNTTTTADDHRARHHAATTTTAPSGPVPTRQGQFHGIGHDAAGSLNLYRQPDGQLRRRARGHRHPARPDYDVYVVPGPTDDDPTAASGSTTSVATRAPSTTRSPPGPIGDGPWTVLVWCQTFGVPVAGPRPS